MINMEETEDQLRHHLKVLTEDIGERSVAVPSNLKKTENYIASFYERLGLEVERESYRYESIAVANVITETRPPGPQAGRYLLGAHYDSLIGTVGADDNASAIAVQLETARALKEMLRGGGGSMDAGAAVKFVSFALEEPPAFLSPGRGSKVHARGVKKRGEKIDGMLCLEMVGYSCREPESQAYPVPLLFRNYPREGNFIGIVGDFRSMGLARSVHKAFQKNMDLPAVKLAVPFRGWLLPAVRRSDNASFWDQGFKAVMITDTADYRNPHYHQSSDTMDKLDFGFMAQVVKSLLMFFAPDR